MLSVPELNLFLSVGLVVSLFLTEFIGIATGGLIVPGYLAMELDKPVTVLATALAGFIAYWMVTLLSRHLLIFGRRKIILSILLGFIVSALFRSAELIASPTLTAQFHGFAVIGYVVPGLIAISMERFGLLKTLAGMVFATVLVKFAIDLVVSLGVHL